jgi:hypothetical protein
MAGEIPEIKVAVRSRSYSGMFPFEFSIIFIRFVRHCRWQTICTFDDVRITKVADGKTEMVITLV